MGHKFDPAHRERLTRPERLELLAVERLVAMLGLRAGERVLDAGCGVGVFTVPLARAVGPAGRVWAVDIDPGMVEACAAATRGLAQVTVQRSEESRLPLPAASVDLVFACHLLHELDDPGAFLAEVRRVLAPGGRVAAVEWEKVETGVGPPLEHRLAPADARRLLEAGGFAVTGVRPVTWANYLIEAR